MIGRYIGFVALAVAPSLALAQRGGARTAADKETPLFDKDAGPVGPSLRVRDLEDESPIKLLIDKHKDLKLTDAQVAQLKTSENTLKDKNAPLLKTADSLIHALKPGNMTDQERARLSIANAAMADVLSQIGANYDAASKDALAQLDVDQQAKATPMLDQQKADAQKTNREKLVPRGPKPSGDNPPND